MPNNRNARKAMRQSAKNRLRNRITRSTLRTVLKKVREPAAGATDAAAAEADFRLAVKKLDQAASKNVIHPNKAARLKSRLSKLHKAKTGNTAPAAPAAQ